MVDTRKISYRKLLLSKQFYKHGVSHSENNTYIDRCLSIHHFHLSIDMILNSIIEQHNVALDNLRPRSLRFSDKINKINNHFKDKGISIPYEKNVLDLNERRNNVQHDALAPEYLIVEEYMISTEQFLRKSFELFFWQDFDNISEISLIEDTELRRTLEEVRKLIENHEYQKSVNLISVAYLLSSNSIGKNIDFSPKMVYESGPIYLGGIRMNGLLDGSKEVPRDLEKIQYLVELGLSHSDYNKFTDTLPYCFLAMDGTVNLVTGRDHQLTYEQTLWALEFFTQVILRWQSRGLTPKILKEHEEIIHGISLP
ncbi:MAG: hypothetical protein JW765_05750 [Deltaproteobacteria bacterium]|nr:hypothetical protein [Candidatus Zymogenaceae bacterium]